MRNTTLNTLMAAGVLAITASVRADVSVAWTAPPSGSTYPVGTAVTPIGQASASGMVGGSGLDLALVIDTSASMQTVNSGHTRIWWAQQAAVALLNSLPEETTAVTIIRFDQTAGVYRQLTDLVPTSNRDSLIAAINALTAPGSWTGIGLGINAAAGELTSARHTVGRSQQMVVLSDGMNNTGVNPVTAAAAAVAAGVDAIHTVGVPGHDAATMRDIANGPSSSDSSDDYGVYTAVTDLSRLVGLFDGTGGNLVGIDHVDLSLPDGTFIASVPVDGLGNFAAPAWAIEAGAQSWIATAYDTVGNSASATLTLNGESGGTGVPDAGSTLALLGAGLLGLGSLRRRLSR